MEAQMETGTPYMLYKDSFCVSGWVGGSFEVLVLFFLVWVC